LATFLRELHGVPAGAIPGPPLPVADGREAWSALYARIRERLFPRMRPDARAAVARHFETFLAEPGNFARAPALRHGDFGTTNILFDAAAREIAGVIDFGSAGLGDPAVDVASLLASYGEPFLARCRDTYPEIEVGLARARFYTGTFALQEALFGVEHDDREAFAAGMADYV
jgi:aminoglycoside 2''-phosphotransferase